MKITNPLHRLVAALIDRSVGILIFLLPLPLLSQQHDLTNIITVILLGVSVWILAGILFALLQTFLTSELGGSLGKLASGISVQRVGGGFITIPRAFLRNYVGGTVSGMFLGLGYLWILKDEKRQGWHDMVADTVVVTKRQNGLITGIVTLTIVAVLIGFTISAITAAVLNNLPFYQSLVTEASQPPASPSIPSDTFPDAWPAKKFIDSNILSVSSDAKNIRTDISNYPYGVVNNLTDKWGLVNYDNEPVSLTISFKKAVKINFVFVTLSSCLDKACYEWNVSGDSITTPNITVYSDNPTSSIRMTAMDPVNKININVKRIGGPDYYVHIKNINIIYDQ
jgi:uncharacterized RDD family membrane protein YckC